MALNHTGIKKSEKRDLFRAERRGKLARDQNL